MRRVAISLAVIGLLSACGGSSDSLEGDLAAASEIIQIPAAAAEPVARDRYGFTNPNSEATIDVFAVDASVAERFEVFEAPRADPIEFVRNPVSLGALANVLDPAETIVVILIPLIDQTRDFVVDFDAFFVSLDASGSVVASDYSADSMDRLDELFDFGRTEGLEPAEILAITARGLNADPPTPLEDDAVALLFGG
ncbi:MAG: hypothetical protein OEQ47_01790 [Acidimicrobiia bacterium]|nr:hypothetical protein [Acidimicrobiia bacterium]